MRGFTKDEMSEVIDNVIHPKDLLRVHD